ncbi:protein kinase [Xanthomonas phaseoli pv. phaseoli]|uniref:protein kinase n=1 Tax=Xanthomonas TaxID=338 RepID=UPI000FD1635B|nr:MULTISPECIES: protein kinase [Xanthomonas]AZU14266.1 protein kinase [Xanthomonas phaseoli pv. phaseoli]AZU27030.1 protein kinase [Xanthomonas phaseoli pv. phaseoli]AZU31368.1 protein kinase [Xanthomonas sp. ISO98C4]AZU35791.1 protein kinase [Xanthomonas phaseoli pv. phaseoli]
MHEGVPISKVFYHPIEAAIRWAGLLKHQRAILTQIISPRSLPHTLDFPRWTELRLYTERLYDAIFHHELPYGINGITVEDEDLWDSPELTIRHVDLKQWMRHHYPEHRPAFLFSRSERMAHPTITLETGHALLIERQAMKAELQHYKRQLHILQEQYDEVLSHSARKCICNQCSITDRAESTYQNIIGGMLDVMLSRSPAGKPYSSFRTQEAIVSALVAHHGGLMGITERTLNGKFAQARRKIRSEETPGGRTSFVADVASI